MTHVRRAFTLIELLVVTAIIAVLAAILFPVFAQAKEAARKAAALSNAKGLVAACALYGNDHDDVYPLKHGWSEDVGWKGVYFVRTPADWNTSDEVGNRGHEFAWANTLVPYLGGRDLLQGPGEVVWNAPELVSYDAPRRTPRWANYNYNGLLTEQPASAVARPSELVAFWQGWGARSFRGFAVTNPVLYCFQKDQPCRYMPARSGCDGVANGTWSVFRPYNGNLYTVPEASMWLYGRGITMAMADGSARFRRMGATVDGPTDHRTDPYTQYDARGVPRQGWYDEHWCHPLLFRPDFEFDFEAHGAPTVY